MNLLEVDLKKLLRVLGTDPEKGLSRSQVLKNREDFPASNRSMSPRNRIKSVFFRVFGDAIMILFIVLSLISALQHRSEFAFDALLIMLVGYGLFLVFSYRYILRVTQNIDRYRPFCRVKRGGKTVKIRVSNLVPGDILLVSGGERVPCDGIILKQESLRAYEQHITGNSEPVIKKTHEDSVSIKDCPYFDCILFAGTVILSGEAELIVCNLGNDIFDKGSDGARRQSDSMPKAYETASFISKQLSLVWILVSFVIFLIGISCRQEAFRMFCYVCTLVVAALPSLITVLSELAVAIRLNALMKKGCIIKNMAAVDKLCDTNVISVNDNRFFIHSHPIPCTYYIGYEQQDFNTNPDGAYWLLTYCIMTASDPNSQARELFCNGKSIDRALAEAAANLGIKQKRVEKNHPTVKRKSFDPTLGFSCNVSHRGKDFLFVIRGVPDEVISRCSYIERNGEKVEMTEVMRERILGANSDMTASGQYVCALAKKTYRALPSARTADCCVNMVFIGLVGLYTPIRTTAAKAVNSCVKADISVLIMTRDLPDVTLGLAHNISLFEKGDRKKALTESDLSAMDRGVFLADLKKYKLFSSLSAQSKKDIVELHKQSGDIVTMVTEGIADTPVQTQADISVVSAGEKTPAVRDNADLLLTDDNFDVLPECIKTSRSIYNNILHLLQYIMTMQFVLLFLPTVFLIIEKTTVLNPAAIVLFGVAVILPTAIMLILDRGDPQKLTHTPGEEAAKFNIYNLVMVPLFSSAAVILSSAISYRVAYFLTSAASSATSATVITLFMSSVLIAFSLRTENTLFSKGEARTVNPWLIALTAVMALFCAVVTGPAPVKGLINTAGIGIKTAVFSSCLCLLPLAVCELIKIAVRYAKTTKGDNQDEGSN
ncbi:MAG: cation transporting ATPase C-terminal domain-containing protein [Firmicutes bacterium]|nr:cation transporting ATPase C-terminal domain-containing protein [Bacillota bacterium]